MSVTALPTMSVAAVNRTRRNAKMWLLRVSPLSSNHDSPGPGTSVVDPVPAAQCQVCLTVAPTTLAIPPMKKVTAKGKMVAHQLTHPWDQKVMHVTSPPPDISEALGPNPPIASPSMTQ